MSDLSSIGPIRRLGEWLDAMPHPPLVCEIAQTHVAAARWGRRRLALEGYAIESLPEGAVTPSPMEGNIRDAEAVHTALRRVLARLPAHGNELALLVPDAVVRVFILPFETFPRRAEDAMPMLRFRLKKSVPFDVEETTISAMRQKGRSEGLEIVAALARQKILSEYEAAITEAGAASGVVLSSTLAALAVVADEGATLVARLTGTNLTIAIVHGDTLCFYRSTEMGSDASVLEPKALLDEIFPAVAFYQDTWGASLGRVRLAGLGQRLEVFRQVISGEVGCAVVPFDTGALEPDLPGDVRALMRENLEALVGWTLNRGA